LVHSMKTREELEEMTNADLREYAEGEGVAVLALDNKGNLVDKILGEYKAPSEKFAKAKPDASAQRISELTQRGLYDLQGNRIDAPLYNLTIHSTDGDNSDVDIVVNGYNIRVQRGVEVQVMEPFVQALRNAVITTNVQDPDTHVISARQIQKYPHQASPV